MLRGHEARRVACSRGIRAGAVMRPQGARRLAIVQRGACYVRRGMGSVLPRPFAVRILAVSQCQRLGSPCAGEGQVHLGAGRIVLVEKKSRSAWLRAGLESSAAPGATVCAVSASRRMKGGLDHVGPLQWGEMKRTIEKLSKMP
ncbi:hypothetical protein Hsc_1596 [Herbaspirillum seropedicae]|nr:hypothetical protein Hsc_1596 [Herbaspirillum seropedicae]